MKKTTWIIALLLGFLVWAIIVTNIELPIGRLTDSNGIPLVISPAEIPIVLSEALAGPPGIVTSTFALLLSLINGSFGRVFATSLTHIVSGVWLVFAYRHSYQRIKMPLRLAAWVGIIIVYFMIMFLLYPLFNAEQYHFRPTEIIGFYKEAGLPALYELVSTLVITLMIQFALPEKYRRPMWY